MNHLGFSAGNSNKLQQWQPYCQELDGVDKLSCSENNAVENTGKKDFYIFLYVTHVSRNPQPFTSINNFRPLSDLIMVYCFNKKITKTIFTRIITMINYRLRLPFLFRLRLDTAT